MGVQEVQLQGLQGALQQLQQETEQNCRRELQQVHKQLAGKGGPRARGQPRGQGPLTPPFLQGFTRAWSVCVRAVETFEDWSAPSLRAARAH